MPHPDDPPTAAGRRAPPWSEVLIAFRWPLAVVALGIVAFFVYRETLVRADRLAGAAGHAAAAAADRAERIARGFWRGDVTERFLSALPEIVPTGHLEVAQIDVTETLRRADDRRVLWDAVPLGTTVTEIRVPVTYRYHVRLDDPWRVTIEGGVCTVYAPTVRPTLPPALHTDGLEKRIERGWLRFDSAEQLDALERSLTPRLSSLAGDPRHLALARQGGRQAVADFVRRWLIRADQWGGEKVRAVEVIFPEEAPAEGPLPPG